MFPSKYNFSIPVLDGILLYNSKSGAVQKLIGLDGMTLAELLCKNSSTFNCNVLPNSVTENLLAGEFLVPDGLDELKVIQDRFLKAKLDTPIVITITATMDCNLGCYYCYETRSGEKLEVTDLKSITEFVRSILIKSKKTSLHVDWYGGEPLLNKALIENASIDLQSLCVELGVKYAASIISNGTSWPDDVESFVSRNKINQVQITFDGLRKHHNQRRKYRRHYLPFPAASSFDEAINLVHKLVNVVRVDVRFNIDHKNQGDIIEFFTFAESLGWFNKKYPPVIQPARISAYSDKSNFLRKSELSTESYNSICNEVRIQFSKYTKVEEAEVPDGYPFPKTSVCAALAIDSHVIGADKKIYRCGLQVSEPLRSVGAISDSSFKSIPIIPHQRLLQESDQQAWWDSFDPTKLPTCSKCSFLPICWGGCPKKHLENDTYAIAEQSAYWRKNLARLILQNFPYEIATPFEFTEQDQFRIETSI